MPTNYYPYALACNYSGNIVNFEAKVNSSTPKGLDSEDLSKFYEWFVGFSDAEGSFWILPVLNSDNGIKKITFVFSIELHKDEFKV